MTVYMMFLFWMRLQTLVMKRKRLMVCNFVVSLVGYLIAFVLLDGQLRNLIMENLSLMWASMYPVVLKEIADEETALFSEMVEIMSLERAAREIVVLAFNEFGPDYDAGLLDADIEGYVLLLGDCRRRMSELSALGQVVQELHDLEGDVTFYDNYTLEELRNVLEEVTVSSKNVLADWVGGVHVD